MPSPGVSSAFDPRPLVTPLKQLAIKSSPFDQHHYQRLIRAREETIRNVLRRLSPVFGLKTALDAGPGLGFFSQTLADCGLSVRGFDGRAENVAEARKRFPHIAFEQADLQDYSVLAMGKFDLVLCFGLLYHLENPSLAVRHLRSLTEKCLLLESMCVPDDKPSMLLREEPSEFDQGLTDLACYPSEDSLTKMLYRAGFDFVYRLAPLPRHDDFRETFEHRRKRTVLLASSIPIDLLDFVCVWRPTRSKTLGQRCRHFRGQFRSAFHDFWPFQPRENTFLSPIMSAQSFPEFPSPGAWDVGDFDLWVRFFRHARRYSVDALIGGYRFHSDSISSSSMESYNQRCDNIIESELKSIPRAAAVKVFRRVSSAVKNIPKVRGFWQRIAVKSLYHLAAQDWPPVIVDQENKWVIRGTSWRTKTLRR